MASRRRWVKITLIVLAVFVGLILLVISPFIYSVVYFSWVPAFSASHTASEAGAEIRIDLYLVPPFIQAEYDRYLYVTAPSGMASKKMFIDWGGATRTSLYRTPDRKVIILGPAGDDYSISTKPLEIGRVSEPPRSSDTWVYLGAFDIYRDRSSGRGIDVFRFFTAAEQPECIPVLESFEPGAFAYRPSAHQRRCNL
jgi:hypothetical protein